MAKNSLFVKLCDFTTKYSIYLLVFLMPIFFLPWTSNVLDFNKQALLVLFVVLALFSWMAKVLISGEFSVNFNKTHVAVLVLFLVELIAMIFSQNRYGSFWGWPQAVSEGVLTIISLAVLYFLISNVFAKKDIATSLVLLAISSLLAAFFGILQLFNLYLLPLDFTKTTSFNTVGSVGSLGIFAATLTPLFIVLAICSKRWLKLVFGLGLVLSVILLVLINYSIVWWVVLISSGLLMFFGAIKRESLDLRWLSLPMFFLVLALFFLVLKPQINVPSRPTEIFLNQKATLEIVLQTLRERPILGSGPGTFIQDFSKYKNIDFNQGVLWNVSFGSGSSKFLSSLAETGILGIIAIFGFLAAVIFYGVKFIFKDKSSDSVFLFLSGGALVCFISQAAGFFLYDSNLSLDFLYFFLAAAFIGLSDQERKVYTLKPSSFLTLGATFIFTLFFIFGLGLLILDGQKYAAEVNYFRGETALAKGNLNQGIWSLEKAVGLNPGADIYLTELSQMYLLKIADVGNDNSLSQEDKNKAIQVLVNNSINAAKLATDASPGNVSNWSVRGFVYRNLIGLIDGVDQWAITSYDEAIKLAPTSPYYPTQNGLVYMAKASALSQDKTQEKEQALTLAKEQFDKAVQLKSDYSPALFQIAMVYQQQGKIDQALSSLEDAKKAAPNDVGLAFQIGLLYYQKQNYQKAKIELERAILISPNYSNALYFLGLTYFELGEKSKAVEKFTKVAELNPNNQDLKKIIDNIDSGKKPLDGIVQETPAQAPVEEEPEQETKK